MNETTVRWLVYTCLIGLIPVLARLLIWIVSKSGVDPVSIGDLVTFGLVLHVSNIQQVNSSYVDDKIWKDIHTGSSSVFVVMYSILMLTSMTNIPNFNYTAILQISIALSIVSFLLSFAIFYRFSMEQSSTQGVA